MFQNYNIPNDYDLYGQYNIFLFSFGQKIFISSRLQSVLIFILPLLYGVTFKKDQFPRQNKQFVRRL